MSKANKKNQKCTQFWKHHIKQWSESGMSQNNFRGHLIYLQKLKHLFKFIPLHG